MLLFSCGQNELSSNFSDVFTACYLIFVKFGWFRKQKKIKFIIFAVTINIFSDHSTDSLYYKHI